MDPAENGSPPGERGVRRAIQTRLESIDSGNYRTLNEHVLSVFADWLDTERDISALAEIDVVDCRRYAQWLRKRATDADDSLSPSSAAADGPYFTVVRSFLEWCVADERLDSNPARPNRVKEALPERHGTRERQFWTEDDRESVLAYADERAHASLDEDGPDRETAFRNRALVYLLALSGVRGAEVFREPRDDHREGLTWGDVDFERGLIRVFGKSREYEWAQVPTPALERLDRWRRVLDPGGDDWPVFPTGHYPSLSGVVRDGLREEGWSESEIDDALDEHDYHELLREHGLVPPAISTSGARNLMQRLCEEAEIDVDGEYLKPHGARRGLGHQLYAEGSAELAQDALRHKSVETTHQAYRDERAAETREAVERVLDGENS